jgi:membrane protein
MFLFNQLFWKNYIHDPKEVIDALRVRNSLFLIHLFKFSIFVRVIFSEYSQNNCFTRASALAYVLLLTLIPLVVSAAFMLTSLTEVNTEQVEKMFSFLLPFAPKTVLTYLSTFFENAQKLKGIGIGVLIIMTVGLFGTLEDSLNTIWKVSRSRSFFIRLRTFTMMMVYSPILFLTSFQLRRTFQIETPDLPFISILLPFILVVLAFTSLIFFVPNTKVRFLSALTGGLIAGSLFELERRGFGTYVELSMQTQTIYGAFGILSFFLISLFLVSLIILLGVQIAYVHQNFRPLLRAKKRWDRRVGDYRTYITLRIMIDCIYSFIKKKSPPTLSNISNKYELTESQAQGILKWLIHEGYLHNINNKDAFVPTRDFSTVSVKEIIDAIEDQSRKIPTTPDDYTKTFITSVINNNKEQSHLSCDNLTFAAMITYLEVEEQKAAKVAASLAIPK